MSPLGPSSSISAVSGRRPAGPGPAVRISQTARSEPTIASNSTADSPAVVRSREMARRVHASILPQATRALARLVAVAALAGVAGGAEAIGPTVITRVDDLVDAPRALFGRTRAEVERVLGVSAEAALRRVEITTPAYPLPHGLSVGETRRHVEETLGEPQELTEGRYLYLYSDGYPDTVEVYFREHRVHRLEWNYWTE